MVIVIIIVVLAVVGSGGAFLVCIITVYVIKMSCRMALFFLFCCLHTLLEMLAHIHT